MMHKGVMAGLAAALTMASMATAQQVNDSALMMQQLGAPALSGRKLKQAIDKAAAHPLGSRDNPVRADGPAGQHAYLSRLRCADQSAPAFARGGSVGIGVYGYMLDVYEVACAGAQPVSVFMDMYHRHDESSAVPGFTIAAPGGRKRA